MGKFLPKQIKEKISTLKAERSNFETQWQEIADYMFPRKNNITINKSPGQKRNLNIFDSTGMNSLELLAGSLHGMLTNPNGFWFELTTGDSALDKLDEVRLFLQESTRVLHNMFNNSNFQTEVHELYLDLCGFGTSAMLIEEDDKVDIRFATHFIGQFFIEENHLGLVDQLYRVWDWTADKIVAEYGEENCHKKVKDAFKKGSAEKFKLAHAIYPSSYVAGEKTNFAYVSQTILFDLEHELRVGGFEEFPYVAPRWSKGTGEKYGTSPAMIALPEVKVINKMEEIVLNGAAKVIDPPIQLPDDGYILPIITRPGGINYKRSGSDPISPIFADTRIDFGFAVVDRKRQMIKEAFYIDQLQLRAGPQKTATEVMQIAEEQSRLLGPMLGRQHSEFLRPLVDRAFNIAVRRNKINLDLVPEVLRGKNIDVRYTSLIARAQRSSDAQSIMRVIQAASPFIQLDPSIVDLFNGEKTVRVLTEVYGAPQEMIRNQVEIDTIRKNRQDMAQQQQAALEAQQTTEQAVEIAKQEGKG